MEQRSRYAVGWEDCTGYLRLCMNINNVRTAISTTCHRRRNWSRFLLLKGWTGLMVEFGKAHGSASTLKRPFMPSSGENAWHARKQRTLCTSRNTLHDCFDACLLINVAFQASSSLGFWFILTSQPGWGCREGGTRSLPAPTATGDRRLPAGLPGWDTRA